MKIPVKNFDLPGVEFYVSGTSTTRHAKTQHALIESFFALLVKARQWPKKYHRFQLRTAVSQLKLTYKTCDTGRSNRELKEESNGNSVEDLY